jgi:hypothetical protein
MARTTKDLEALPIKTVDGEPVDPLEEEEDEALEYNDLVNALDLLGKCAVFFSYLQDKELCKSLTKRERDTAGRMAVRLFEFVTEVQQELPE